VIICEHGLILSVRTIRRKVIDNPRQLCSLLGAHTPISTTGAHAVTARVGGEAAHPWKRAWSVRRQRERAGAA
jgi:hypothetical protein